MDHLTHHPAGQQRRTGSTRQETYAALPPRLEAGHLLGDLRIVSEIARGGTATVYRAETVRDRRQVALKVLSPHLALIPEALLRFQTEGALAARVRHPAIVPVFEAGDYLGHHYYAMELERGETAGRLSWHDVGGKESEFFHNLARLFSFVARALEKLHSEGIVHRDVKPDNLVVGQNGYLRLCDFGSALDFRNRSPVLEKALWGTVRYMSPEQFVPGHDPYDPLSDVYALGVSLYELVTGCLALTLHRPDEPLALRISRRLPAPRRINPSVPLSLDAIVRQAIDVNPRLRYPSASDFAEDLERFAMRKRGYRR